MKNKRPSQGLIDMMNGQWEKIEEDRLKSSSMEPIHEHDDTPQLDVKVDTREVPSGIIHVPWLVVDTPYMYISDQNGTRKVWIKSKKKILLYYLYEITRIKWFIKKYLQS